MHILNSLLNKVIMFVQKKYIFGITVIKLCKCTKLKKTINMVFTMF